MKYIKLILIEIKNGFVYKIDTIIGIMSSVISLIMQIYLWKALWGGGETQGITLEEMVAYQVLGILFIICYDSDVSGIVGSKVMDGSISMDLLKPYNYPLSTLCGSLGRSAGNLIKKGIPYLVIAMILTNFQQIIKKEMIPIYVFIMIMNLILYWQIFFQIGMLHFVFVSAKWLRKLLRDLIKILSGNVIPLWYFPEVLSAIIYVFPFWLLFQFPQSVLIGQINMTDILKNLLLLLGWNIVIGFFNIMLWKRAIRMISIQGG